MIQPTFIVSFAFQETLPSCDVASKREHLYQVPLSRNGILKFFLFIL